MKKMFLVIIAIVPFIALYAAENCVIINKQSTVMQLSLKQIQKIFLKKNRFIQNQEAVPVNLLADNEIRILFEKKVLKIQREFLNEYWVQQHFLGIAPPLIQASFESVKRFVENVPGAIGYIPKTLVDGQVKVVYEF